VPRLARLFLMLLAATAFVAPQVLARPAAAQVQAPSMTAPPTPNPGGTTNTTTALDNTIGNGKGQINIDLGGLDGTSDGKKKPGQSVVIILLLTLLAVAPALLMMMTSFTRIVIVLSLTRNALGLTSIPPNQVVVGLSLFLSLFVMFPTLQNVNDHALQPLLNGDKSYSQAWDSAQVPIRKFMLKQTRKSELDLFIKASRSSHMTKKPETRENISMATLIPAFVLSELKTAFIIGFVIFIPFLIIDLVISSALMSMGMFMLPPVLVSLPFKLLLFVMVDGWALIVKSLITSFH
jgi:flagellar biosynthetic protein FliP